MQSQIDLALNLDWGNEVTYITEVIVPKGTTIHKGYAAPQTISRGVGVLLGGGNQVFIEWEDVNKLCFR